MRADINQILIFKTNIQTENDKANVSRILDSHEQIRQWNVDMEDVDCVLRIVSETLSYDQVIDQITSLGYECSELP